MGKGKTTKRKSIFKNAGTRITTEAMAHPQQKDRLFRMVFHEKKDLLSLYNALNGTHYENEEDIEIVTLENAIYMNMKNDLAFVLDAELNLYEHQSTFSHNMPLRDLFYISRELQKLVDVDMLYRSKLVKIPTPRFLVLYNGTRKQPERQMLKLSNAFEHKMETPELELIVTMLNINAGYNQNLMEQCQRLKEYMLYVERVRKYAKQLPIDEAVERAVKECIEEDILREFLRKYRKEAVAVSIFEYNEERALQFIKEDLREEALEEAREEVREEARAEGRAEGREEGTLLTVKIIKLYSQGVECDKIAEKLEIKPEYVARIIENFEKE